MPRQFIPTASPLYIIMLGLLSALAPFGTDVGLPSLPNLQSDLGVEVAQAILTLTLFLVGFSLGPILFGPLSDRYGRKPILLFGVGVFALAAVGSALATSISTLLVLRVIQGVGAGAASSLPPAIVRDVFRGEKSISRQSYVALVNSIMPLCAPLIGAAVMTFGTWRTIYWTLSIIGGLLFVLTLFGYKESAPLSQTNTARTSLLTSSLHAYKEVLSNRHYLLYTALLSMSFGVLFAYISSSSAVFMQLLQASPVTYSFLFAFTAFGGIVGAAFNGRFASRLGTARLMTMGVAGNLLASLLLLASTAIGIQSITVCAGLVIFSCFCFGTIMPNAVHQSLRDLGVVAGSAASLQRSLQMITGACSASMAGALGGNPLISMALIMSVFAALALIFLWLSTRSLPRSEQPMS